jgi:hypothetical protein
LISYLFSLDQFSIFAAIYVDYRKESKTRFQNDFQGKWGGGTPKPFKFTEIQKHRFNLKSKESEADRQIPAMPLVFLTKDGKISRYNLRKFAELPYHLVRFIIIHEDE